MHTFVHGRLLGLHFGPLLMVLLSPLHEVRCCRRHDFAVWIVGFLGRSGFSGNVSGGVCGWRVIRRQCEGVWDPDSSSGGGPGLVDPYDLSMVGHAGYRVPPSHAQGQCRSGKKGVPR